MEFGKLMSVEVPRARRRRRDCSPGQSPGQAISGISTQAVGESVRHRDRRPHPRMWGMTRHEVTATWYPTSADVAQGLEAFQEPPPGPGAFQTPAGAQPIACRRVSPLDRFGRLAMCAVQPCADVPSAWARGRDRLDVRLTTIGHDFVRDHPGVLDGLAKEGLHTGRVAMLRSRTSTTTSSSSIARYRYRSSLLRERNTSSTNHRLPTGCR